MSHPRHTRRFIVAAVAAFALLGAACSFDSSPAAEQQNECRNATIDHATRDSVHATLGSPTVTEHETIDGQRRVVDVWIDGHVGFGFDAATGKLVEKDCDSG
jgi:hypothetical protein